MLLSIMLTPMGGYRIGYASIQICALLTASPARTALPTAHCERDVATIRETAGLLALIHGARKIPASQGDQSDYGKVKHQS
jgi:hypothetical protein